MSTKVRISSDGTARGTRITSDYRDLPSIGRLSFSVDAGTQIAVADVQFVIPEIEAEADVAIHQTNLPALAAAFGYKLVPADDEDKPGVPPPPPQDRHAVPR